jgi:hypothetical protein
MQLVPSTAVPTVPGAMRIRIASLFAIVSLAFTAACGSEWAVQPLPQGPRPDAVVGSRVRVTRVDGEVLELTAIRVRGDSLYGLSPYGTDPYVVLPLSNVVRVEAQRTSSTVPALLTLGAAALVFRWLILPQLYD